MMALEGQLSDWTAGNPELVVSRCAVCSHPWYLTRAVCPRCRSSQAPLREVSPGLGQCIGATTLCHQRGQESDMTLVMVRLEEGVTVLGLSNGETVAPGDRVSCEIEKTSAGAYAPLFHPTTSEGHP